jgi:hypothetical protein
VCTCTLLHLPPLNTFVVELNASADAVGACSYMYTDGATLTMLDIFCVTIAPPVTVGFCTCYSSVPTIQCTSFSGTLLTLT